MDYETEQSEEREALDSIYEGDDNFTKIESNVFQYKVTFLFLACRFSMSLAVFYAFIL